MTLNQIDNLVYYSTEYLPQWKIIMNKNTVNTIGFWSALLAFILSNTFTVGAVAGGMFPKPWDARLLRSCLLRRLRL